MRTTTIGVLALVVLSGGCEPGTAERCCEAMAGMFPHRPSVNDILDGYATKIVYDEDDLKRFLHDDDVAVIRLGKDIIVSQPIVLEGRINKVLDGGNKYAFRPARNSNLTAFFEVRGAVADLTLTRVSAEGLPGSPVYLFHAAQPATMTRVHLDRCRSQDVATLFYSDQPGSVWTDSHVHLYAHAGGAYDGALVWNVLFTGRVTSADQAETWISGNDVVGAINPGGAFGGVPGISAGDTGLQQLSLQVEGGFSLEVHDEQLTGSNPTLTPGNRSFIAFYGDATGTITIAPGERVGQRLTLWCMSWTSTGEFASGNGNVILRTSSWVPGLNDVAELLWTGSAWVEMGR